MIWSFDRLKGENLLRRKRKYLFGKQRSDNVNKADIYFVKSIFPEHKEYVYG